MRRQSSAGEGNPQPVQAAPGTAVHPPEDTDRKHLAGKQGQRPEKRPCLPADKPKRKRKGQAPWRVAHVEDTDLGGEPRRALSAHHGVRIIGAGMVGKLLAGSPEDDEIAPPRKTRQRHDAEKQGGKCKRQSCDTHNHEIREIVLFLRLGNRRIAGHGGYSTSGEREIIRAGERFGGPRPVASFPASAGSASPICNACRGDRTRLMSFAECEQMVHINPRHSPIDRAAMFFSTASPDFDCKHRSMENCALYTRPLCPAQYCKQLYTPNLESYSPIFLQLIDL